MFHAEPLKGRTVETTLDPAWLRHLCRPRGHLDSRRPAGEGESKAEHGPRCDSPAAGAGLQKGDVITAMNGTEIESLGDLIESIHHLAAGEPSKVRVLRGLEEKEFEMTPQFASTVPESR